MSAVAHEIERKRLLAAAEEAPTFEEKCVLRSQARTAQAQRDQERSELRTRERKLVRLDRVRLPVKPAACRVDHRVGDGQREAIVGQRLGETEDDARRGHQALACRIVDHLHGVDGNDAAVVAHQMVMPGIAGDHRIQRRVHEPGFPRHQVGQANGQSID